MASILLICADDGEPLSALAGFLGDLPGVEAWLDPAQIPQGVQGAEDILTVAVGSGGAATVALLALRDWIGSTTTKLRVTVGDRSVELESKNADRVIPMIGTLLNDLADTTPDQPGLTDGELDHGGR